MHIKKEGTVLISAIVILSLMSLLGSFMYNMIRNNVELCNLYSFDKDIYDISKSEEEILFNYMKNINREIKENVKDSIDGESNSIELFSEDFERKIDNSTLKYYKSNNKLFLITKNLNNVIRTREIIYNFENDTAILIPTYSFQDSNE
ncbi:hypothetical protein [Clostridium chromiireducens]|uniref:Uncharacterized protein n=1 Tax=Clostridium chromiireducens TaxID=225345 RepID=A0A1V4INL3_9CLOT|nr:hypothetical protein [Clostridium chromiireducens]OPJ61449.1 hypothetical protein CLCHR_24290 [Clostridium chromiireducens]RII33308.1 hypothetical protein D2A34_16280 [Clostridium chromiireducens]